MARQYEVLHDFTDIEGHRWKEGTRITVSDENYRAYWFFLLDHSVRVGELKFVGNSRVADG